jgi:hypothetical protein
MLRTPEDRLSNNERKRYAQVAREVLEKFVGPQGVRSVLFYTGEPDQGPFEENLRKVFGAGAGLMLKEISSRLSDSSR